TPVDNNAAANAVNENAATGTLVGVTAFASDADATTNTVSYAITGGTGQGLIAIDHNSAAVTTAAPIHCDALGASRTIIVTATSADSLTTPHPLTSTLIPYTTLFRSTPVDNNAAANAVNENVAIGTLVGVTAFASDADATTNTVSYAITGGTGQG